jgi:hypothetical protein
MKNPNNHPVYRFLLPILGLVCFLGSVSASVTLVDGTELPGEVLFEHPNAPLLIVRSPGNRTLQSVSLAEVHAYEIDGRKVTKNPLRELNAAERQAREHNGLWGDEAGPGQIGRYATETWESAPVMVWARPGESGDGLDHENWLDATGKVWTEDPWVREAAIDRRGRQQAEQGFFSGDILVPAADNSYEVLQAGNRDHLGSFDTRHLTIEANADYRVRYHVFGNLWVKDGARMGYGTQTGGLGSAKMNKHTFARFCNWHDTPHEPAWAYAPEISHWVWVDTGPDGSLEIIGKTGGPGDRFSLRVGTFIVSKDSAFRCGNRAGFFTAPGTTLVLLDGAMIASPDRIQGGSGGRTMGTYGIGGTILFGHPDKPLTRDLEFSACLYDMEKLNPLAMPSDRASGASWVFGPESRAVVHSSDPTTARVLFVPRSKEMPLRGAGPREFHNRPNGIYTAPQPEVWEHPDVPRGVIALFRGETDFDGVHFDGFYEGGILVDPAARARWRNVTFGDNNLAEPDKLFRPLEE